MALHRTGVYSLICRLPLTVPVTTREGVWRSGPRRPRCHDRSRLSRSPQVLVPQRGIDRKLIRKAVFGEMKGQESTGEHRTGGLMQAASVLSLVWCCVSQNNCWFSSGVFFFLANSLIMCSQYRAYNAFPCDIFNVAPSRLLIIWSSPL